MIDKLLLAITATVAITGIGTAAADQEKLAAGVDTVFKSLDRDGDQRVSKSEATGNTMLTEHFATIDADKDGYLTEREYSAHVSDMKKADMENKQRKEGY